MTSVELIADYVTLGHYLKVIGYILRWYGSCICTQYNNWTFFKVVKKLNDHGISSSLCELEIVGK